MTIEDDMLPLSRYEHEEKRRWRKRGEEVPKLNFPSEWEVRIIPPFGGADARFQVYYGDASVSVYLDLYNSLGVMDRAYWEVHPIDGDTFRCYIEEDQSLMKAIQQSIDEQNKESDVIRLTKITSM